MPLRWGGAELEALAAAVRQSARPHLVQEAARGDASRLAVLRGFVLAQHVTATRVEDGVAAHQALLVELERQLREAGLVDEGFTATVAALKEFLYAAGWHYGGAGEWVPRGAVTSSTGRRS
jgi:hypothetical protein